MKNFHALIHSISGKNRKEPTNSGKTGNREGAASSADRETKQNENSRAAEQTGRVAKEA